jgi:hypothetical protein
VNVNLAQQQERLDGLHEAAHRFLVRRSHSGHLVRGVQNRVARPNEVVRRAPAHAAAGHERIVELVEHGACDGKVVSFAPVVREG